MKRRDEIKAIAGGVAGGVGTRVKATDSKDAVIARLMQDTARLEVKIARLETEVLYLFADRSFCASRIIWSVGCDFTDGTTTGTLTEVLDA